MDKFLAMLGGLVVLALAFLLAPVGIAAALTWGPAQTTAAMTGLFSVCGGGIVAVALALGLGLGIAMLREHRASSISPQPPTMYLDRPSSAADATEYLRQQKLLADIQRQQLMIERERRALAPPPADRFEEPVAPSWIDATEGWE